MQVSFRSSVCLLFILRGFEFLPVEDMTETYSPRVLVLKSRNGSLQLLLCTLCCTDVYFMSVAFKALSCQHVTVDELPDHLNSADGNTLLPSFFSCRLAETIQYIIRVSNTQPYEHMTWPELPNEILALILSHLPLRDNIRGSSVCKTWLAAAIFVRVADKPMWIMSFPQYNDDDFDDFYDPSQKKICGLDLPELHGSTVCYARDGWLLLSKTTIDHVFFFCPYTRESIELPNHDFSYQYVAFFASPKSPSCVIFTIVHPSKGHQKKTNSLMDCLLLMSFGRIYNWAGRVRLQEQFHLP
ncbi:hypothetical protein RD792_014244 [Penstemon davidsonii]|uniref:F-box domain-containing protein n=1 Tax=Penstemon davidsonii TaxID=160366 RepID=A0ABR0CQI7_9LAMI|nr:hypothetical protein RD792_014244 [Penstemon davidsonii]